MNISDDMCRDSTELPPTFLWNITEGDFIGINQESGYTRHDLFSFSLCTLI